MEGRRKVRKREEGRVGGIREEKDRKGEREGEGRRARSLKKPAPPQQSFPHLDVVSREQVLPKQRGHVSAVIY